MVVVFLAHISLIGWVGGLVLVASVAFGLPFGICRMVRALVVCHHLKTLIGYALENVGIVVYSCVVLIRTSHCGSSENVDNVRGFKQENKLLVGYGGIYADSCGFI